MPEIDNDLFKLLVAALLAITALLLLALLAALARVRKILEQQLTQAQELRNEVSSLSLRSSLAEPAPAAQDEPRAETPLDTSGFAPDATPILGGAAAAGESSAAPAEGATWDQEQAPSAALSDAPEDPFATPAQPAAEDPFAAPPASTDDPFATASPSEDPFSSPAAAEDAFSSTSTEDAFSSSTADDAFASTGAEDPFSSATADEPFATSAATDDAPATSAEDPFAATPSATDQESAYVGEADQAASQSTFDEPEDQPFERNGRWFFRRDDELLVYEEGTGEWVPADPADIRPAPPPPATTDYSVGEAGAGGPDGDAGELGPNEPDDTARFDTVSDEPRPAGGGGFWKCPSCGAVNGSSASTCRMCFSARP